MTRKIAISLPDTTLAHAKAIVSAGRAESVSGYIATLLDQAAAEESVLEMTARWDREDGLSARDVARRNAEVRADFASAGLLGTRPTKPRRRRAT